MSHEHRRPDDKLPANTDRRCITIGECRPRARSSKNTRDWCRGRVGIPHAYMYDEPANHRYGARDRWVRQEQVCFGCGRQEYRGARTRCRQCGSPPRNIYTGRESGWHYKYFEIHKDDRGPYCLCPDNFEPRASTHPHAPWADDPVQIAALTAQART